MFPVQYKIIYLRQSSHDKDAFSLAYTRHGANTFNKYSNANSNAITSLSH